MSGPRGRRALVAVIGALTLFLGACGASENTKSGSSDTSGGPDAPVPERVSEADVLKAVQEATTLTKLPAAITADDLIPLANNGPDGWSIPGGCQPGREATSLPTLEPCTFGAADYTHTMMVIGDSHAAMWRPAFDLIGKRIGWRVIVLTKGNCGPADLRYYLKEERRPFSECDEWQQWRLDQIREIKPSIVATAGYSGGDVQGPDKPTDRDAWQAAMERTVKAMPAGTHTVLIADQPHLSEFGPECLAKNANDLQECSDPAEDVVPANYNDALAAAAKSTGATYVDVMPWFCTDTCPYAIADMSAYVGSGHVNKPYAERLSGVMQGAMQRDIDAATKGDKAASGSGGTTSTGAGAGSATTPTTKG